MLTYDMIKRSTRFRMQYGGYDDNGYSLVNRQLFEARRRRLEDKTAGKKKVHIKFNFPK